MGYADGTLVKIAKEVSKEYGFNIILSDNHLTRLSFIYSLGESTTVSIDMKTSIVIIELIGLTFLRLLY